MEPSPKREEYEYVLSMLETDSEEKMHSQPTKQSHNSNTDPDSIAPTLDVPTDQQSTDQDSEVCLNPEPTDQIVDVNSDTKPTDQISEDRSGPESTDQILDVHSDTKPTDQDSEQNSYMDHGWAWAVVVASFFSNFLADGIVYSVGVLYVVFLDEFRESKSHTSVIATCLVAFMFLTGLFASAASDKFGFRPVAIAGSVMLAGGFGLGSLATNLVHLYLSIGVLGGVGAGLVFLPSIACVQHYFDKRRSLAAGIATSGSGAGTFAMAPLIELLLREIGWRMTLLALGGMFLLIVPIACVYRPTTQANNLETNDRATTKNCFTVKCRNCLSVTGQYFKHTFNFTILKNSFLDLHMGSVFLFTLGWFVPYAFIFDQAISQGISAQDAAFILSIMGITNTAIRIAVGLIGDFKCINRLALSTVSIATAGFTVIVVPFCSGYVPLAIDMGVFGLCTGCYISLAPVVLRELISMETYNRSLGFLYVAVGLGQAFHPLAGAMHDLTGDYNLTFFIAGGMLCGAAVPLCVIQVMKRICAKPKPYDFDQHESDRHIPSLNETTKL